MNEDEIIQLASTHLGRPWLNGKAYVIYRGYDYLLTQAGFVVDDLSDVIEVLRERKDYELSDRLRTIRNRLKESVDDIEPRK